jgi:predicted amidohydrolase YtcJ
MFNREVVERSGALGMYWSLSPGMFAGQRTETMAYEYGEEVVNNWFTPVKALLDAGAKVTFEGEYDASDPMKGFEVLVTRMTNSGKVRGAKHAVDRKTALRIVTRWGAEYVLREDKIGTIQAGKFADLIILDKNPLDEKAVPSEALSPT